MKNLPNRIEITKTPFIEQQEMTCEIDRQKRFENPDYKGAFYEKKKGLTPKTRIKRKGYNI